MFKDKYNLKATKNRPKFLDIFYKKQRNYVENHQHLNS